MLFCFLPELEGTDCIKSGNIHKYLQQRFAALQNQMHQEQEFCGDPGVQKMVRAMHYVLEETSLQLNKEMTLITCPSIGCEGCLSFSLRNFDSGKETHCEPCYKNKRVEQKKRERKRRSNESGIDRSNPSTTVPFCSMTPDTAKKRARKTRKVAVAKQARIARLVMKKLKENVEFQTDDKDVIGVLRDCFEHCKNNADQLREEVVKVLVESTKNYSADSNDCKIQSELQEHAASIVKTSNGICLFFVFFEPGCSYRARAHYG